MDLKLVNLDSPDEVREFEKGRFETYRVGPMTLGRATYEPGWKWSEHVGKATGETSCQVEHVGWWSAAGRWRRWTTAPRR